MTRHWTSAADGRCEGDKTRAPSDSDLIAALDGARPYGAPNDAGVDAPSAPSDAGDDAASTAPDAGGTISNASSVVANMRAGFRACYNQLLRAEPLAAGHSRLVFHVNCRGAIIGIHTVSRDLNPWLLECLTVAAAPARFAFPYGGSAVVIVPLTFVRVTP